MLDSHCNKYFSFLFPNFSDGLDKNISTYRYQAFWLLEEKVVLKCAIWINSFVTTYYVWILVERDWLQLFY